MGVEPERLRPGDRGGGLTKDFENRIKRCMASIHLMLYQEIGAMKWELAAETKDTLLSAEAETRPAIPGPDQK